MSHFQRNIPKTKSFFPPHTCFFSSPSPYLGEWWSPPTQGPYEKSGSHADSHLCTAQAPQQALPLPALQVLSPTLSTIQVWLQAFITALLRDLSSLPLTPSSPEQSFYNANPTSCHSCLKRPFRLRQHNIQHHLLLVSHHAFHFAHILSYLQFPTKAMTSRISVLLF